MMLLNQLMTVFFTISAALALLVGIAESSSQNDSVLHLSQENFDELTAGKAALVMFYAPWCEHSKALAPSWQRLADDYKDSPHAIVAKVDCSKKGRKLCQSERVNNFPTIMYGDPASLAEYHGGRTYQDLALFAKENLQPPCSPSRLQGCDAKSKQMIEELLAKSKDEIKILIEAERQKLKDAKKLFDAESQKLQRDYQQLYDETDKKVQEIEDSGLALAKWVLAYKKSQARGSLSTSSDEL